MKNPVYANLMLTVIAALLALNLWIRSSGPIARAQTVTTQFRVATIMAPQLRADGAVGFQKQLNAEANGGEIAAMVSQDQGNSIVVVFTQSK